MFAGGVELQNVDTDKNLRWIPASNERASFYAAHRTQPETRLILDEGNSKQTSVCVYSILGEKHGVNCAGRGAGLVIADGG